MNLTQKVTRSYIFFKFAICSIALLSLGETCHLKGRDVVSVWRTVLLLSCYDCDSTCQYYDVTGFEYVLWCRTMHEWVMNIHYQTWIAQGRFINMIRTPSKQWGMCDNTNTHWGLLWAHTWHWGCCPIGAVVPVWRRRWSVCLTVGPPVVPPDLWGEKRELVQRGIMITQSQQHLGKEQEACRYRFCDQDKTWICVFFFITDGLMQNNCSSKYCQTPNISHTLVGDKIVDHSDGAGASSVSAAPTTSPIST